MAQPNSLQTSKPLKLTPVPVITRYGPLGHLRGPSTVQFCCSNPPQAHQCKSCNFTTDLRVILRNHRRATHVRDNTSNWERTLLKNYTCKHCDFQTFSLLHLTGHWYNCRKKIEMLSGQYKCDKCSLSFRRSDRLNFHAAVAHTEAEDVEWFKCEQCAFRSMHKQYLSKHRLIKHPLLATDLQCEYCKYKTKVASYMRRHTKRRHTDGVKLQKCTLCPYRSKQGDMEEHHRLKHSAIVKLRCRYCEYTTQMETELDVHERTHPEIKEAKLLQCEIKCRYKSIMEKCSEKSPDSVEWVKCDQCVFKTSSRWQLATHVRKVHAPLDVTQRCKYCGYSTNIRGDLEEHEVAMHEDKWYKCDVCQYSTKRASSMTRHRRKHPVLQCKRCPYSTKMASGLRRHLKKRHDDENV